MSDSEWQELAEHDALWAVLSDPAQRHGGWDQDEFFATGSRQVGSLMEVAERLGRPLERSRALDFGCGPGRLSRALADHFDSVLGVDIAPPMIESARRMNADREQCRFELLTGAGLRALEPRSFDLVYTSLVLQHMDGRAQIMAAIGDLLDLLRPGGLAAFQVPIHIRFPSRLNVRSRVYRALRRVGVPGDALLRVRALNPMRMNFVPRPEIEALIAERGLRVLQLAIGPMGPAVESGTWYVTRD